MEDIVYEVIGGAIILGIILLIIMVFRNSAGSIKEEVQMQSQLEDVTALDTIGIDGGVYNSSKVQEAYNYSMVASEGLQVWVKNSSATHQVTTKEEADSIASDRGARYKLEVMYLSTNSNSASIPSTSDIVRHRGDKDIAVIRFTFVKQ